MSIERFRQKRRKDWFGKWIYRAMVAEAFFLALWPELATIALLAGSVLTFFRFRMVTDSTFRHLPFDVPVAVFVLVGALSILVSPDRGFSFYNYYNLVGVYVLTYLLMGQNVQDMKQVRGIAKALGASAVLVILYGFYQYIFGIDISAMKWVDGDAFPELSKRVFSTWENPNILAGYLDIVICLAVGFFAKSANRPQKIVLGIFMVLALACLGMTYARGACLTIAVILLCYGALKDWRILLGCLLVGAGLLLADTTLSERLLSVFTKVDTSSEMRLAFWESTVAMIQDHPFLGIGWGVFWKVYPEYDYYMQGADILIVHAHNIYLNYAAEIGIAGALAFFWYFFGTMFLALKVRIFTEPVPETVKNLSLSEGWVDHFSILQLKREEVETKKEGKEAEELEQSEQFEQSEQSEQPQQPQPENETEARPEAKAEPEPEKETDDAKVQEPSEEEKSEEHMTLGERILAQKRKEEEEVAKKQQEESAETQKETASEETEPTEAKEQEENTEAEVTENEAEPAGEGEQKSSEEKTAEVSDEMKESPEKAQEPDRNEETAGEIAEESPTESADEGKEPDESVKQAEIDEPAVETGGSEETVPDASEEKADDESKKTEAEEVEKEENEEQEEKEEKEEVSEEKNEATEPAETIETPEPADTVQTEEKTASQEDKPAEKEPDKPQEEQKKEEVEEVQVLAELPPPEPEVSFQEALMDLDDTRIRAGFVLGIGLSMISVALNGITDDLLFNIPSSMLLWMLCALAAVMADDEIWDKKEKGKEVEGENQEDAGDF